MPTFVWPLKQTHTNEWIFHHEGIVEYVNQARFDKSTCIMIGIMVAILYYITSVILLENKFKFDTVRYQINHERPVICCC